MTTIWVATDFHIILIS